MGAAAAAAASLSIATPLCPVLLVGSTLEINSNSNNNNNNNSTTISFPSRRRIHDRSRKLIIVAATKGSTQSSKPEENNIPSWAKPDSAEPPPWAQNDSSASDEAYQVPFYVYLLASAITAIAAIGSIFEYINEKPVFGVLNSDSVFYAPLLGFFAFTGIPTSAFLWYKSVQTANKAAEEQDRKDGYR